MSLVRFVLLLALDVAMIRVTVASVQRPNRSEWEAEQSNAQAAKEADASKNAKMAAVDKVAAMLQGLQAQVMAEGEKQAKTYDKFACFCKDITADKTEAIQRGSDEKASLASAIEGHSTDRDALDQNIQSLLGDIEASEKTMATAKEQRLKELKLYTKNSADMQGAIGALDGATASMKASKSPSLVQRKALTKSLRNVLGRWPESRRLSSPSAMTATAILLQEPAEVEMEDYKSHSEGIIKTLEGLSSDFRDEKADLDAEEVRTKATHTALVQEHTDIVKNKNVQLGDSQKRKAEKQELIASSSEQLSTVSATLLDDQEYLRVLSDMCAKKAKTWDQRSQVRQDELSALNSAISIIKSSVSGNTTAATVRLVQRSVAARLAEATAKNPRAMEEIEAQAEAAESETSFLQRGSSHAGARRVGFLARTHESAAAVPKVTRDGRALEAVEEILRNQGEHLHSTRLTSLASRIGADPLAKVKTLIQELVERLLKEEANDATQKGWCDKSTADATQKRDYAAVQVEELNGEMAEREATRDTLAHELDELRAGINALASSRQEAEDVRANENAENAATVVEAKAGLAALAMATDIIGKFYKTAAKQTVQFNISLAQQRGPFDDAPDAGFDNGEAYTGAQGEAGGIIGMLDVIKSDFERTVGETEKSEAQAKKDHLAFMTASGKSLAVKQTAQEQKSKQKDDQEEKLAAADVDLQSQTSVLTGAVKELGELKAACIDTGMSYAERKARRADEQAALKKALCILEQYAAYGPDGVGGAC